MVGIAVGVEVGVGDAVGVRVGVWVGVGVTVGVWVEVADGGTSTANAEIQPERRQSAINEFTMLRIWRTSLRFLVPVAVIGSSLLDLPLGSTDAYTILHWLGIDLS